MTAPLPLARPAVEPYRYTRPGPHRARTPVAPTDRVTVHDGAAARGLDAPTREVLDLCRPSPIIVADLAAATGLPPGVVLVVLTDLENTGAVTITAALASCDDHGGGVR
ncbi:DUF742 domain-containing protein [Streptomonospora arabica]|uniref:DUF742 domain-containing protein n=1 Tax=Streptomonospora arabica TaxID=412417 RepID=A0ABV9SGD5_9ACTN